MNNFLLILFSSILVVLTIPVFADSTITISTDKIQYERGESVIVSGNVNDPTDSQIVELMFIAPGGGIFSIARADILDNGSFTYSFIADDPSMKLDGKYIVRAGITADNLFETVFFIGDIVDDPPSEIIVNESDLYECESESCVDDCNQDPTCTVSDYLIKPEVTFPLSFVDPTKDLQSYVDRYNNEPEYKEWFDSNYPEYTIYQAVGLSEPIPEWVRGIFVFWANGDISDNDLKNAIKFLVTSDIIVLD